MLPRALTLLVWYMRQVLADIRILHLVHCTGFTRDISLIQQIVCESITDAVIDIVLNQMPPPTGTISNVQSVFRFPMNMIRGIPSQ
jgi:hypothetical protein